MQIKNDYSNELFFKFTHNQTKIDISYDPKSWHIDKFETLKFKFAKIKN